MGPQRGPSGPKEGQVFGFKQQINGLNQVREENRIKGIGFLLEFECNDPNEATNQWITREENGLQARAWNILRFHWD